MSWLLFIAWAAFANYCAAGGPYIGEKRWRKALGLPGRSIYWAGVATMALGYVTLGWPGFWAGVAFLFWRLPGWYGAFDAGSNIDPPEKSKIFGFVVANQRLRDFVVMSARGLLMFPPFLWAAWQALDPWPIGVLLLGSIAQGAAYDIGNHNRILRPIDGAREMLAGGAWGVAFHLILIG